jgi:RAQPRD family integrative conjugative element protein
MKIKILLSAIITLLSFNFVNASELEKELLLELVAQIKNAKVIAVEAKRQSSESDDNSLEYEKLLWDLTEIGIAVERHVKKPSTKPRKVKELYLNYDKDLN